MPKVVYTETPLDMHFDCRYLCKFSRTSTGDNLEISVNASSVKFPTFISSYNQPPGCIYKDIKQAVMHNTIAWYDTELHRGDIGVAIDYWGHHLAHRGGSGLFLAFLS